MSANIPECKGQREPFYMQVIETGFGWLFLRDCNAVTLLLSITLHDPLRTFCFSSLFIIMMSLDLHYNPDSSASQVLFLLLVVLLPLWFQNFQGEKTSKSPES